MTIPKKAVDSVFLLILGTGFVVSMYMHIAYDYVLTVNYYLGLLLWALVVFFKLIRFNKELFGTLILLTLLSFNIVNFTIYTINATIHHFDNGLTYSGLGLNGFAFLLLLVYCIINKSTISDTYKKIFGESEKEQIEKRDKLIGFYYQSFSDCSKIEFEELYNNYDNYPEEAQEALSLIKAKKGH